MVQLRSASRLEYGAGSLARNAMKKYLNANFCDSCADLLALAMDPEAIRTLAMGVGASEYSD